MKTAFGFFGAGKMAEGILCAMTRLDGFDPSSVVMAEKVPARARELSRRYGVRTTPDVAEAAKAAKTVFLAVRPQDLAEVAAAGPARPSAPAPSEPAEPPEPIVAVFPPPFSWAK